MWNGKGPYMDNWVLPIQIHVGYYLIIVVIVVAVCLLS
jgi:hypothetical protein